MLFMLDVTQLWDEIICPQYAPQVEQPPANFESTPTPNVEGTPTPTTTQGTPTPSVVSEFYI